MSYLLYDDIKYRREAFGCAVTKTNNRSIRFYNETAASIIEACTNSKTEKEIAGEIGYSTNCDFSLHEFLQKLVNAEILTVTSESRESKASLFFTEINEFPSDYFFMPLGVEIELTLKCSRNCSYCSYNSSPLVNTKNELTFSAWCNVMNNLHKNGIFSIRFTGGDPFTRSDIIELLQYADKLGFAITVGSDLTVLTKEHIQGLKKIKNLHAIQTTLDGATAETNDFMRGYGNFQKVINGIKLLRENHIPFIVGTVVHKLNLSEINNIGQLVASYGAAGYCIAPLYPAGRGKHLKHLIPSNTELALAHQEFRKLVNNKIVSPADTAWLKVTAGLSDEQFNNLLNDQSFLARQADRLLRIDPQGRCYTSIKLKEYLEDSVYIGNIMEMDLKSLWQDSSLLKILRKLQTKHSAFGEVLDVRNISSSIMVVK